MRVAGFALLIVLCLTPGLPIRAQDPTPLSEAELSALGLSSEDQGLDTTLHLGGFMDATYLHLLNPDSAPLITRVQGEGGSFFIGRLNFIVTKNLTETFRMMAEVRFLYSPNGSQSPLTLALPTSTEVIDYSGNGASVRWGSILIERAYGEWSPFTFLSLRLGSFLTPYGIWNVDHGTPVYIPTMRPYAVGGSFFPERQTGLEAFGQWWPSTKLALRYHLTLSNGLGPISDYRDLDDNKAIGGRLALEYVRFGTIQLGGSIFHGRNTSGATGIGVDDTGTKVIVDRAIYEQFDVTALAADLLWKFRGVHFQAEWVGKLQRFTEQGRQRVWAAGQAGIPADAVSADSFDWAGYVLAGYRLPWLGIMPYATLEYQRSNTWGILTRTAFSQLGLNIRPVDAVVLKLQLLWGFAGTPETRVKFLSAQLAWAF